MLTPRTAAVIFFFMGLCGLSLVDGQILNGRVIDAVSGKPISGVNLMIDETTTGTASTADGTFSIPFPHVPAVLVASHLSYQTAKTRIVSTNDTLLLSMEPALHELGVVDISANKVIEIMKSTSYEVLDFEFMEEHLLLLANTNGNIYKPCLLVVNLQGDTLSSLNVSRPGELYRDFGGEINYLTSQSAWKVAYHNNRLSIEYMMDVDEFLSTYPAVVDVQEPWWMLQQYSMERLKLNYYRYNEMDSSLNLFCSIINQTGVDRCRRGAYFDGTESDFYFATHMMNRPVHAPLFRLEDGYVVFNFNDQRIEFFEDDGTPSVQVNAGFMKDKQCSGQILRDRVSGDFYTIFEKTGLSTLYLINIKTGTVSLAAKIPNFVFVENIIIRNSEAFFLYKDKFREEQKKIYRMKI